MKLCAFILKKIETQNIRKINKSQLFRTIIFLDLIILTIFR